MQPVSKGTSSKNIEKTGNEGPPSRKRAKLNPEEAIAKSMELIDKVRSEALLNKRMRQDNTNDRFSGNEKSMPSLMEVELMFDESDCEDNLITDCEETDDDDTEDVDSDEDLADEEETDENDTDENETDGELDEVFAVTSSNSKQQPKPT